VGKFLGWLGLEGLGIGVGLGWSVLVDFWGRCRGVGVWGGGGSSEKMPTAAGEEEDVGV